MTQTMNAWFSLTLLLLIVASAPPAAAQTAGSFEQLAVLVESGDRITVTDSSGREHTGRIIDLSPSGLELWTDGARQDFREPHVYTISQVRWDTLGNGAWFGFAHRSRRGSDILPPEVRLGRRIRPNVLRPVGRSWHGRRRWTRCPGAEPAGHLPLTRHGSARHRGAAGGEQRPRGGRIVRLLTAEPRARLRRRDAGGRRQAEPPPGAGAGRDRGQGVRRGRAAPPRQIPMYAHWVGWLSPSNSAR